MNINDVELTILASVTKGYTAGRIIDVIQKVVQIKQEDKYSNNICTSHDFLTLLAVKPPVFIDEEDKIKVKFCIKGLLFNLIPRIGTVKHP